MTAVNLNLTMSGETEESDTYVKPATARIVQVVESFTYGTAKSVKQLCAMFPDDDITVFYGTREGTHLELRDLNERVCWMPLPGRGATKHLRNIGFLHRSAAKTVLFCEGAY